MYHPLRSVLHATLLLAAGLLATTAQAQSTDAHGELLVLRIDGLDSATRDALTRETARRGDVRVVFACVPAGLLVLQATDGATRTVLAQRTAPLLAARSAREETMDLAQAEERCAQHRGR